MRRHENAIATPDWVKALSDERSELLAFCADLSAREWCQPSAASGWRIQDVVAHIGSGCHAMFGTAVLGLMASDDIERTNDTFVDDRREWVPMRTLDEYRRWSGRVVTAARFVCRTPLRAVPMPLAELGRFPMSLLLCGAMTFDHHTHLRHDIAPALGRTSPATDPNRMAVVLAWMFAVLGNQMTKTRPDWFDRPIGITLVGPGGGTWTVDRDGVARGGPNAGVETWVTAQALDFPEWGTQRVRWAERDVTIVGDQEYGAAFLDVVNVV